VSEPEERARSAGLFSRMDGRQEEQPSEQDCPCRQEKVRCLHNHIGNRTAFRHGDLLRLEADFPSVAIWSPMMGYGLKVAIISAQARATAESGEAAPGIVAQPPFSTNVPRSQA
jgi:hypothetical protein